MIHIAFTKPSPFDINIRVDIYIRDMAMLKAYRKNKYIASINKLFPALSALAGISAGIILLEISLYLFISLTSCPETQGYFQNASQRRIKIASPVFVKCSSRKHYLYNRYRDIDLHDSSHIGPNRIPAFQIRKPEDEIRIFIIGESVAELLYDYNAPPDCARNQEIFDIISRRFPGSEVNLIQAGFGGSYSYEVLSVAREIIRYDPDIVLILMGNNFSLAPYWQSAMHENPPPFARLLRYSITYGLLCDYIYSTIYTEGIHDLEGFSRDYNSIAEMFSKNDVDFAAFMLPVNYADMVPVDYFRPVKENIATRLMLELGQYDAALQYIDDLERTLSASLIYNRATALRHKGRYAEAREDYKKALEKEIVWKRANRQTNHVARETAERHGGFAIDLETLMEFFADDGLSGRTLFFDNCHWFGELNPPVFKQLMMELNRKYVAGHAPVPSGQLKKIHSLKTYLPHYDVNFLKGFFFHVAMDFPEQAVYTLSLLFEHAPETAMGLYDYAMKKRAELSCSEGAFPQENLWHKVPATIGEAARITGYTEVAGPLLDTAVEALSPNSEAGYIPFVFRAFYHVNKNNIPEAMADFQMASRLASEPFDL